MENKSDKAALTSDTRQSVTRSLSYGTASARLPLPAEVAAASQGRQNHESQSALASHSASTTDLAGQAGVPRAPAGRWSASAWLLVRREANDTAPPLNPLSGPSYGASQAGAIIAWSLAPSSGHRPALYGRVAGALRGVADTEAAFGARARPVPSVPVALVAPPALP
jgi:hypothetical protein